MTPEQQLVQAMMSRGGRGAGMMGGGGMAQDPRPPQPQQEQGLLAKILALLQGQQSAQGEVPQYMPLDTMPPDAQALQRRKEEILRQAMMGAE